jgi:hypothetical protein
MLERKEKNKLKAEFWEGYYKDYTDPTPEEICDRGRVRTSILYPNVVYE